MSLMKITGVKSYVKEKLIEGIFVVGVVSGRSIVAAGHLAAMLPYPVSAWLSPITIHSVSQCVVVKWKKRMCDMGWASPEAFANISSGSVDPKVAAEAKAKREAEQKIEEEGRGDCAHCKEELVKNERGIWESEFLVEYCSTARDHKHKPLVTWKVAETDE